MSDFAAFAAAHAGLEGEAATRAARSVLSTVGDFLEPEVFASLCAALGETEDWLPRRQGTLDKRRVRTGLRRRRASTTGMFGASGQSTGGVAGLLGSVKAEGIEEEDASRLLGTLVAFVRERAGGELSEQMLDGVPALRLLGAR